MTIQSGYQLSLHSTEWLLDRNLLDMGHQELVENIMSDSADRAF
jgi:hypothetical protein